MVFATFFSVLNRTRMSTNFGGKGLSKEERGGLGMQTSLSIQSCHYIVSFSSETRRLQNWIGAFLGGTYLYNQNGGLICKAGKQYVSIGGGESLWILPLFILIMCPCACF